MSDFLSDLEAELVAAARRRAGSRRRVVLPRLRPATVVVVVALAALLVAALAVVRELDGSRPADEQRTEAGDGPQRYPLSIFTRPQTEPDAMPSLVGTDSYSWIPAGTIFLIARGDPASSFDKELHLVPIAEPRRGDRCGGEHDAVFGVSASWSAPATPS